MVILKYPLNNPNIQVEFWKDFSEHPVKKGFYELFDNHHPGVDFQTDIGDEVIAAFEGIVVRDEFHRGMGNVIGIRNGNILALYAHLSKSLVELGQVINSQELVGLAGDTGDALIVPHLHFELRNLSKTDLKDMVFKPEWNKHIKIWSNTFIYKVNNQNSKKTLALLSKRYFGSETCADTISEINSIDIGNNEELPGNIELIIPNYQVNVL